MKKRILGILFSFALMMVMMPVLGVSQPAYAEDYDLWVGGIQVTSTNESDILGESDPGVTASYNHNTQTLTLNNYSYNKGHQYESDTGFNRYAAIYAGQTLNIKLEGDNYVKCTEAGGDSGNGIHVYGAGNELTISGTGTLEASGYGLSGMGIYAVGGDITINGGTVTALSNNGSGIVTDKGEGSVIISDGIVTASGNQGFSAKYVRVADDMGINAGDIKETAIDVDKTTFEGNHAQKWVQASKAYPLWVRGTRVMVANEADVLGDNKVSFTPATDDIPATLTLKRDVTANPEYQYKNAAIYYNAENELIIDAAASTVTGPDVNTSEGSSIGIRSAGPLTVKGKLTANCGNTDSGYGVIAPTLAVDEDAELTAGGEYGISISEGNIAANGKLTATGSKIGIFLDGGSDGVITVNSGAELTAAGDTTAGIASSTGKGVIMINEGAKLSAVGGNEGAVDGIIKNAVPGLGWTNKAGSEGKTYIRIDTQQGKNPGADIKNVKFPAPEASVTTAPAAKTLTYNGSAQELVTAGKASGGTIQYALGKDGKNAPESDWSTAIPKGTNAGTYYVWYKAVGDDVHSDSEPACVTVKIAAVPTEHTITFILNGGSLDGKTGTVTIKAKNGTVIILPEPERDGYEFDYWEGSKYYAGEEYTVNGDHTFRAVWKTADNGGGSSKKGVKTGDDNNVSAWIALLLAALAGTTGLVFVRKKKGK